VRRESTDIEDVFIGHIGAMDTFALALRRAAAMHESGVVQRMVDQRYASYADGIGAKVQCAVHTVLGRWGPLDAEASAQFSWKRMHVLIGRTARSTRNQFSVAMSLWC
jgi:hypothetical protein